VNSDSPDDGMFTHVHAEECQPPCHHRLVSFPDDFSLSGGKIRLVICLFHFGSGVPECWRIVLFQLSCDVMQDYIPTQKKFLNVQTGCQEQAVEN